MDRRTFEESVYASWDLTEKLGLALTFSNGGSLEVNDEMRKLILNHELSYSELYRKLLSQSHYNFLCSDYSFLQFTWIDADHSRFAYYPNPHAVQTPERRERLKKRQELLAAGMLEMEDFLALMGSEELSESIPPIRYDCAPSQHKPLKHPASHMHIGHNSQSRWPLDKILTPKAFTALISKLYYSTEWGKYDDTTSPAGNTLEEELAVEKARCWSLGPDKFSEVERNSFHVS
ncbi:MAG: DUF2290 domain-containing protein [Methylocystis silviterrae]|uniref:DUF2290 domain-containing protein n=1 Tax=Methylocystis silviterrae TaxID=2743612 RepID=UPI003C71D2EA